MIDTLHLLPPDLGPRSSPMLYGVAEAIAELFPPVLLAPRACEVSALDVGREETVDVCATSVSTAQA